ncbi:MAG: hypothetical protein IJG40_16695 [Oscillospiraceae bacterium]|nr:hypothetical protein [Oscillospiraceae bacterium]
MKRKNQPKSIKILGRSFPLMPLKVPEPEKRRKGGSFTFFELLNAVYGRSFLLDLEPAFLAGKDRLTEALSLSPGESVRSYIPEVVRLEGSFFADYSEQFVRVIVRVDFQIAAQHGSRRCESVFFNMSYLLIMPPESPAIAGPLVSQLSSGDPLGDPKYCTYELTPYLLPILRKADYPRVAESLLKQHFPQALRSPTPLDGRALAESMGLKVRLCRFPSDSSDMGIVLFAPASVPVLGRNGKPGEKAFRAGTVLINTSLCRTPEAQNSTVVHECIHWRLDRLFFFLRQAAGTGEKLQACRKASPVRAASSSPEEAWMERQAGAIPGYMMMPGNLIWQEVQCRTHSINRDFPPAVTRRLITELAELYGVSRSMARVRLIENGYRCAEGVFCFLRDGTYVPDHACSSAWPAGRTYAISFAEAAALFSRSAAFSSALAGGRYAYVEGHLCRVHSRYLTRDSQGRCRLTPYARSHIDECCIAFTPVGRAAVLPGSPLWAARKKEVAGCYLPHDFVAEPGTPAWEKESSSFLRDAALWSELSDALPNDLQKAVQLILDKKGLTWEKLSFSLGVDRRAVSKWMAQPRISEAHLVAVVVALNLRADLGLKLLQIGGCHLRFSGVHQLYAMMVCCAERMTVEQCNEILRRASYPPLTRGEML